MKHAKEGRQEGLCWKASGGRSIRKEGGEEKCQAVQICLEAFEGVRHCVQAYWPVGPLMMPSACVHSLPYKVHGACDAAACERVCGRVCGRVCPQPAPQCPWSTCCSCLCVYPQPAL